MKVKIYCQTDKKDEIKTMLQNGGFEISEQGEYEFIETNFYCQTLVNKENTSLKFENNNFSKALHISEIDAQSPYSFYRDIITSNDSYGYKVTYTESNDFHFYFAHSEYEDFSDTEYYPEYICYIKYNGVLTEDTDATIEYIYDENNSHSTTGELESEIMLLSRYLERLPQEIKITIRERGSKLEEGSIIANASFVLYTINKWMKKRPEKLLKQRTYEKNHLWCSSTPRVVSILPLSNSSLSVVRTENFSLFVGELM